MRSALPLVALLALGCGEDPTHTSLDGGDAAVTDAQPRDVPPLDLPDATGDAAVPPLDGDIVSFCADLGDTLCGALERCACGTVDDETCRMNYRAQCELQLFGPDVRRALAEGRLVFDGAAADRMVSALGSTSVCTTRTLEPWTVRDYYTFGGILEGTGQAGEPCAAFSDPIGYGYIRHFRLDECAEGVCDARRCVGFEGVGGVCDTDHFCADLDETIELSWEVRSTSLPCVRSSPKAPSGTCTARFGTGARCTVGSDCESNRCESNVCVALGDVGDGCTNAMQCQSGYCSSSAGQCAAGNLPNGSICTFSGYECASGVCSYRPTGPATCSPGICAVAQYYGLQGLFPR